MAKTVTIIGIMVVTIRIPNRLWAVWVWLAAKPNAART